MSDYESAWLVERTSQRTGAVVYMKGIRLTKPGFIVLDKTTDHQEALRFSRQKDAQRITDDIDRCNLVKEIGWRVAEHAWGPRAFSMAR